ncbi:MAG: hypothetical protein DI626_05025 [Micavibrio aeruginosavorus]|uniref:Uncharacterized protein n=1 Tax=Micavibrio aeruginosavorus TaxID=349221 RepID=A0A2W4ZXH1_9BACT|nr:MAG: hypothetical protein DI626_05025 [Micavibrio aeruginosavorus]
MPNANDRKRAQGRLEEIERYDEIAAEEIMLRNNPDAVSAKGKIIKGRGRERQEDSDNLAPQSLLAMIFGKSIEGLEMLRSAVDHIPAMSQSFGRTAKKQDANLPKDHMYEDDERIYDTEKVSAQTYRILTGEAAVITARLRALEGIDDPENRETESRKIVILAEEFQMRRHPVAGRYIHDIARVEDEEKKHNPDGRVIMADIVCVFRTKAVIGDPRGMKRHVGDVYNQDPEERIATGDHLKGPAAPAP